MEFVLGLLNVQARNGSHAATCKDEKANAVGRLCLRSLQTQHHTPSMNLNVLGEQSVQAKR